ncbi:MADS-box transcription factor 14 [Cryptomeria japonica]|uniref:MADS-box transcription factor 14 n=1 Tax=Cryptomeria japonica TaxID=3369 RepID=UPI0025AD2E67|nr:MADS-box transcription factor 14 [Cryptomeria japonica]
MTQSEKTYKHMIGEDLELLNFKELQCLEKKIKLSVRKIHSRKEKMLLEHIRSLKVKEKSLTVENANLVNKEKSLTVENANLAKRIEKSRTQHFNIDIMEGVTNDLETQQDPPQTDLNLVLS